MTPERKGMTIGAAARQAEVHVETIRYYQRLALLPRPPLARGHIRRYSAAFVDRVRFIKRAQQLGFTLEDIGGLLALAAGNGCSQVCGLAERQMADVRRKIADLQAMHAALQGLVAGCQANRLDQPCPLVQALASRSDIMDAAYAANGGRQGA